MGPGRERHDSAKIPGPEQRPPRLSKSVKWMAYEVKQARPSTIRAFRKTLVLSARNSGGSAHPFEDGWYA